MAQKADAARVKNAQLYRAVRELQRITLAGSQIPVSSKEWLDTRIVQFHDLTAMNIDGGFPKGMVSEWVTPDPDDQIRHIFEFEFGCVILMRHFLQAGAAGTAIQLSALMLGCNDRAKLRLLVILRPRGMVEMTFQGFGTVLRRRILHDQPRPARRSAFSNTRRKAF